ncbi:MAG: chromosome segregation protein ScpA [Candidatus Methanomethylophilaceae archaeon]|nr:chromosome segregation protein ScpA [Candidatus Methanomethylophilaceae archaeon]
MDGNTRIEDLEQHLLFHRALTEDADTYRRRGGYMDILSKTDSGERLSDPVDESIRSVFSLVLDNGIDPWEIDLSEFVRMYERKVTNDSFDMIVAGKLLLMAWKILRLQSDCTRLRSEPPVEIEEVMEVDDDFFFDDEPLIVPEVSLREAYQREPVRPVTMYELIDAFEDARKEIEIQKERERVRAELKAKEPKVFENKAHEEDDERVVEGVWQRIQKLGSGQICIADLYTGALYDNLSVFVSVLHLVRDGRLAVWQDELPSGEIYVEIKMDWTSGTLEDNPGSRIPEAVV